jgi:hypothetical protein
LTADRREYERCKNQHEKIQVAFHPSRRFYPIKDISAGGLAIEYSPAKKPPFASEAIDIIKINQDQLFLSKVACKIVYDIPTLMHGRSFKGGAMRICGLKFVELTKEQEDKLNIFLKPCLDRSTQ